MNEISNAFYDGTNAFLVNFLLFNLVLTIDYPQKMEELEIEQPNRTVERWNNEKRTEVRRNVF